MVYDNLYPPLEDRVDFGFAALQALLANIYRDSKRTPEVYTPSKFMPQWGRSDPESEEDGMDPDRVMKIMDGMMKTQEEWLKKGGRLS